MPCIISGLVKRRIVSEVVVVGIKILGGWRGANICVTSTVTKIVSERFCCFIDSGGPCHLTNPTSRNFWRKKGAEAGIRTQSQEIWRLTIAVATMVKAIHTHTKHTFSTTLGYCQQQLMKLRLACDNARHLCSKKLLWNHCLGHDAGIKWSDGADRLAGKAAITSGLRLGRSEALKWVCGTTCGT